MTSIAERVHSDTVYKQCANCGAPIKLVSLRPDQSLGAILWSDGYVETPDRRQPPILGKCRACEAIGCLAELPEIEDTAQLPGGTDHAFVPLTVDDYAMLLENLHDISLQFHSYLRIRFWQLNNHRRRGSVEPTPLSDIERANLLELLKLLGEADADRLITAEILRQLQEFEAAETVLARPFNEHVSPIVKRIRQLVRERMAGLVKIDFDEPHQNTTLSSTGRQDDVSSTRQRP